VLVIGDVHGCLDELRALLAKANYSREKDSVVLVGDLVNKGPKSAETVRFAREQGFFSVRGTYLRRESRGGGVVLCCLLSR
jgi:bis(5'-nucleosyl)-tetraphosphatase (symmetrical)